MVSIFTHVMSRVTHYEPGLPMLLTVKFEPVYDDNEHPTQESDQPVGDHWFNYDCTMHPWQCDDKEHKTVYIYFGCWEIVKSASTGVNISAVNLKLKSVWLVTSDLKLECYPCFH